jgi:hypothetical protein
MDGVGAYRKTSQTCWHWKCPCLFTWIVNLEELSPSRHQPLCLTARLSVFFARTIASAQIPSSRIT